MRSVVANRHLGEKKRADRRRPQALNLSGLGLLVLGVVVVGACVFVVAALVGRALAARVVTTFVGVVLLGLLVLRIGAKAAEREDRRDGGDDGAADHCLFFAACQPAFSASAMHTYLPPLDLP